MCISRGQCHASEGPRLLARDLGLRPRSAARLCLPLRAVVTRRGVRCRWFFFVAHRHRPGRSSRARFARPRLFEPDHRDAIAPLALRPGAEVGDVATLLELFPDRLAERASAVAMDQERDAAIGARKQIRLATGRRLSFGNLNGQQTVSFHANNTRWECVREIVPALQALSHNSPHSVTELCALLPDSKAVPKLKILLTALAMGGVVAVEE